MQHNPNSDIFNRALSIACVMGLTLSLTACDALNSIAKTSEDKPWSCQTIDQPFSYSVCGIKAEALKREDYSLALFWQDNNNQPLLTFDSLVNTLPSSKSLAFAMNAGMYNQSYAPIGYTVIQGKEIRALNLKEGGGNFHLLPNGVMWWDQAGTVQITETKALNRLLKEGLAKPWYATQSGPMLVIDGEIHPQFNPTSHSIKFRNGAGVCRDGTIQLVNSNQPVTFYQFAALFKDNLGCPNALFLDGGIASALYAPSIDKHDKKDMGVIIGVIATED